MKDLTNLKTYIIDSDDPHEVDDGISLEIKEGNKKILWIHISNPCKLFLHDSNVDLEARKRNCSLYLIDHHVPMLPKDIVDKANLAQNKISETRHLIKSKIGDNYNILTSLEQRLGLYKILKTDI